jgi:HPt (histidine-containing phosphotransfer) domain-containing protein
MQRLPEVQPLDIDRLRPLYKDDLDELMGLIRETVNASAELIERFERAALVRNVEAADVGHELKGLCATIGAKELAGLSEDLEALVKEGRWEDVLLRVRVMREAHRRLVTAASQTNMRTT